VINRQTIATLAITLAALGVNDAYASNIIYHVGQIIGPGSVTGTITTDGAIGILSAADIVSFNLTLNDGSNTANLSPPATVLVNKDACCNAGIPGGVDLTASVTNLMFNYSGADSGDFVIANSVGELCYTATSNCWGPTGVGLFSVDGDGQSVYIAQSGNQIIATTIPEPATWAMTLAGFFGLGAVLRGDRRRRTVPAI
jgi:hypothetical protein